MQLKTERLSIRPFEVEDKEDIFEIYEDEETCRFLLQEPWTDRDRDRDGHFERKRNQRSLGQKCSLSLAVLADDKVIGDIAIWYTDMKETVEIGYAFNKNYSGFGYASEALSAVVRSLFKDYAIHRIRPIWMPAIWLQPNCVSGLACAEKPILSRIIGPGVSGRTVIFMPS